MFQTFDKYKFLDHNSRGSSKLMLVSVFDLGGVSSSVLEDTGIHIEDGRLSAASWLRSLWLAPLFQVDLEDAGIGLMYIFEIHLEDTGIHMEDTGTLIEYTIEGR